MHRAPTAQQHRPSHWPGTPQALQAAGAALEGNRLFVRTLVTEPAPGWRMCWVVIRPAIIQYWADNLAEATGDMNFIAADVFAYVLQVERFGLHTTTQSVRESGMAGQSSSSSEAEEPGGLRFKGAALVGDGAGQQQQRGGVSATL